MSVFRSYEAFLLSNASQITAVESTLRSLTYFLPGRFKDAELAGEALCASLNILGLYHDSILYRLLTPSTPGSTSSQTLLKSDASLKLGGVSVGQLQHTPSPHARYTQYFADQSTAYNVAARALVIVGYTELLAEMVARRKVGKRSWDVVVGIEAMKAVLRVSLLRLTGNRPTIQPPIPEREVDPAMLDELPQGGATGTPTSKWRGARTGLERPTLASLKAARSAQSTPNGSTGQSLASLRASTRPGVGSSEGSESDSDETLVDSITEAEVNEYLLSKTLKPADVRQPSELVRKLDSTEGKIAEGLWIARPVLYALALRRWGRRATIPFLLSLILELLARLLRKRSLAGATSTHPLVMALAGSNPLLSMLGSFVGGTSANPEAISDVERAEWKRRARAFWWYFLRGPVWQDWTRPKLEGVVRRTENKALLGIVGGVVRDYLPLVEEYHFYSAT